VAVMSCTARRPPESGRTWNRCDGDPYTSAGSFNISTDGSSPRPACGPVGGGARGGHLTLTVIGPGDDLDGDIASFVRRCGADNMIMAHALQVSTANGASLTLVAPRFR
jgi:hypothetical protein